MHIGCATETSDIDLYGVYVPSYNQLNPYYDGKVFGYDSITPPEAYRVERKWYKGKMYDVTVVSIPEFFRLCVKQDPRALATLYSQDGAIVFCDEVFKEFVLRNKKEFLSKKLLNVFSKCIETLLKKNEHSNVKEYVQVFGSELKDNGTPLAKKSDEAISKSVYCWCW